MGDERINGTISFVFLKIMKQYAIKAGKIKPIELIIADKKKESSTVLFTPTLPIDSCRKANSIRDKKQKTTKDTKITGASLFIFDFPIL